MHESGILIRNAMDGSMANIGIVPGAVMSLMRLGRRASGPLSFDHHVSS